MVGERTKMAGAHAKNVLSRADQWRQARGEIVGVKAIKLLCPRQQWGCGGPIICLGHSCSAGSDRPAGDSGEAASER